MKIENIQPEAVNRSRREFLATPPLALATGAVGAVPCRALKRSRTHRADQKHSSSKTDTGNMSLLTEEPKHLFSQLQTVGLKDIDKLTRFLPVVILVPRGEGGLRMYSELDIQAPALELYRLSNGAGDGDHSAMRLLVKDDDCEFAFGSVTLNFSTMEVNRDGNTVRLTALEFRFLKYLVQNPGCVLSRDQLPNHVWGYESYPCTRTVDNQILRLRHKLEQVPSRPVHFLTVHGVGYKFLP